MVLRVLQYVLEKFDVEFFWGFFFDFPRGEVLLNAMSAMFFNVYSTFFELDSSSLRRRCPQFSETSPVG